MNTFVEIYLLCAAIGSAAFVFISLRRRSDGQSVPAPPSPEEVWIESADPFDNSEPADVRDAAAVALRRVRPLLADRSIRLSVAMRAGLLVQEPGYRIADVVERMVTALIRNAGSHMVLSAAPRGGQVAICVSNDARAANLPALQAQMRPLTEEVALRGGALDLDVTGAQGTSIVLRVARFNGPVAREPAAFLIHPKPKPKQAITELA